MSSYSIQKVLLEHKQRRAKQELTASKTSEESQVFWKKRFHKNPLIFSFYANFRADAGIDSFNRRNKTMNLFKLKPVFNGYYKVSELNDYLQRTCYKFSLGSDNEDWFLDE